MYLSSGYTQRHIRPTRKMYESTRAFVPAERAAVGGGKAIDIKAPLSMSRDSQKIHNELKCGASRGRIEETGLPRSSSYTDLVNAAGDFSNLHELSGEVCSWCVCVCVCVVCE